MRLTVEDEQEIDQALLSWRQGDVSLDAGLEFLHFADLSRPHSSASDQVADALAESGEAIESGASPVVDDVKGLVMLSQTCDIVRGCRSRPFVEVAPLVEVSELLVEDIRRLKRPAFAYVATTADKCMVADLDRTMTIEKALVAGWTRAPGWETDGEQRDFSHALARKRSRFAFPDDFSDATKELRTHLAEKHGKNTVEGAHLRALGEIRVCAEPSWNDGEARLHWWFIKDADPAGVEVNWAKFLDRWIDRIDQTGRFCRNLPIICRLEELTAKEYVASDRLDLDRLSVS